MKVVRLSALRTGRLYQTENIPGAHFCYKLSQLHGHSAAGRIMWMKNSIETIRNRNRDFPVCGVVPQPTGPPRAPPLAWSKCSSGSAVMRDSSWSLANFFISSYCISLISCSNLMHSVYYIFHIPLHVSSNIVLIIRRIYCIHTASVSLYVILLRWPLSAQAVRGLDRGQSSNCLCIER